MWIILTVLVSAIIIVRFSVCRPVHTSYMHGYMFYYVQGKFIFQNETMYTRKSAISGKYLGQISISEHGRFKILLKAMISGKLAECFSPSKRDVDVYQAAGFASWADFDSMVLHITIDVLREETQISYGTCDLEHTKHLPKNGDELFSTIVHEVIPSWERNRC